MAHALKSPEYLERIREQVAASMRRGQLRAVIAPAVEDIAFEDVTVGDVLRFCGEDCTVVEKSDTDGWLVVMDGQDHCTAIKDCAGQTFTRCEIGF